MRSLRRNRSIGTGALVGALLRGLMICAPVTVAGAQPADSQSAEVPALTSDIPAQPLAQALDAFARQTGLQLVYVSALVQDQKSRAVPSGLGVSNALDRLLQGTGLKFE